MSSPTMSSDFITSDYYVTLNGTYVIKVTNRGAHDLAITPYSVRLQQPDDDGSIRIRRADDDSSNRRMDRRSQSIESVGSSSSGDTVRKDDQLPPQQTAPTASTSAQGTEDVQLDALAAAVQPLGLDVQTCPTQVVLPRRSPGPNPDAPTLSSLLQPIVGPGINQAVALSISVGNSYQEEEEGVVSETIRITNSKDNYKMSKSMPQLGLQDIRLPTVPAPTHHHHRSYNPGSGNQFYPPQSHKDAWFGERDVPLSPKPTSSSATKRDLRDKLGNSTKKPKKGTK